MNQGTEITDSGTPNQHESAGFCHLQAGELTDKMAKKGQNLGNSGPQMTASDTLS
jgi:hypothetical protein